MTRFVALIPAAGVGERFGAGKPKQYVEIAGKTVLQHTIEVFLRHAAIEQVVVILSPDDAVFSAPDDARVVVFRCGGATRAETVCNGLAKMLMHTWVTTDDMVLVHDAARCCLSDEALSRLLAEAGHCAEGGILAIPVADTLKRADHTQHITQTVARTGLWQAQTPQLFRIGLLQQALSVVDLAAVTDEASAVEQLGIQPKLVLGDVRNIKLTLPHDEYLVTMLLEGKQ